MKKKKKVLNVILAGVVLKDGKVLLLKRSRTDQIFPDMWELPSGKRKLLESTESCLIREIAEETGITVKPIMPFSVFDYQITKQDEIRDCVQINYLTKSLEERKVHLSKEHQDFVWITEKEIDRFNLSEKTKKVLQKAFKLAKIFNK